MGWSCNYPEWRTTACLRWSCMANPPLAIETEGHLRNATKTASRSLSMCVTWTACSGLTWPLTETLGATQSTRLLHSLKRTGETPSKTNDRLGKFKPLPPLKTQTWPTCADTAWGPACLASASSATNGPAVGVDNNLPDLRKAKPNNTTPVTRTLKGNEKLFELAGNSSYRCKFQWNFDQGKGNLLWVSGEFELSEFELSRFYCT